MAGRNSLGIFWRAGKNRPRFCGLRDLMQDATEAADEIYSPMVHAVTRFRELRAKGTGVSDEDQQIVEEMMDLMRRLSFFRNRVNGVFNRQSPQP